MKRLSIKEILENKDNYIIEIRDWYLLNAGIRVKTHNDEYVGYLTFTQFLRLNLNKYYDSYGIKKYEII